MAVHSGPPGQSQPPAAGGASGSAAEHPRRVGKYEIQKKIGSGGMGAVFLALDTQLRRTVALKLLPQEKAQNPILVRRFQAEAHAAASLKHDNIVTVYEAGEANGYFFIALEYIEGTDVADLVHRRGVLPVKRSQDIVKQVAKALQHASEQGIVHRDIKPANLLIRRDGTVKLADLGLARSLDETADTGITRAGTTVGTVDYMAPEQARDSKAADIRSDIYSLGCTWYQMLTGDPPFPEGSLTNKLRAHAETPPPDPRLKNTNIPEAVVAVLNRMMAKKPQDRYQTAAELIKDLQNASLSRDAVSETILSDDTEYESTHPGAAEPAVPVVRVYTGPPPREGKPAVEEAPEEQAKRNYAQLLYLGLGLVFVGAVVGLGWMAKDFSTALDLPGEHSANPFAHRDTPPAETGNKPANGKGVPGPGQPQTAVAVPGQPAPGQPVPGQPVPGQPVPGQPMPGQPNAPGQPIAPGQQTGIQNAAALPPPQDAVAINNAAKSAPTISNAPPLAPGQSPAAGSSVGSTAPTGVNNASPLAPAPPATSSVPGASQAYSELQAKRAELERLGLPLWVGANRSIAGLTVLTVHPGGTGDRQYGTLNEAFQQVPPAGAVILLSGDGPFPLRPAQITNKTRIVLQAENRTEASRPLIVLMPAEKGVEIPLQLTGTALELSGVHFAADAGAFKAGFPAALVQVTSGDVFAQNCSITLKGKASVTSSALKLGGQVAAADLRPRSEIRLLLANTVVRGQDLSAFQVESENADLVVRDSLVYSGLAPVVRVTSPARKSDGAQQSLRIVGSTLCSRRSAFELGRGAATPGTIAVSLLNCLVSAPPNTTHPTLVALQGWTVAQASQEMGKLLTWKSTASLYLGWKTLVETVPEGKTAAVSFQEWSHHWKQKDAGEKDQFQLVNWPADNIPDIARSDLRPFAPKTVKTQFVKTSDGGWPGCPVEPLVLANVDAVARSTEIANRPQLPAGLFDDGRPIPRTIRVDVTKEDLGRAITGQSLPNGTLVVASGFGARSSSPIVIQDTWIRIHFEQTEGYPLTISPRFVETGKIPAASHKDEAFITVVNGGVELVNGTFTIPSSERQILPVWFVHVTDGDLAVRQCRIQGPMLSTRNKGLIHWGRTGKPAPTRPFSGDLEGYAAIQNCYLSGSGVLMEADLRRRALFIRNTIAVSRDDGFDFRLDGVDSQLAGVVDLRRSTFSAPGNIFHIQAAPLTTPTTAPLVFFADRCVFATPLKNGTKKPTPTLLAYDGPLLQTKQVTWTENRNGYSSDIMSFLRAANENPPPPQTFEQGWVQQWGVEQIMNPLSGLGGVYLKGDLPHRSKLEPGDFQLHARSKGARWDGSEKPIGADITSMDLPDNKAGPVSTAKPKATARPPAPIQGF